MDDMTRQTLLGNVANNLIAFGQRGPATSPADALMQMRMNRQKQQSMGLRDTLAMRQEDRLIAAQELAKKKREAEAERLGRKQEILSQQPQFGPMAGGYATGQDTRVDDLIRAGFLDDATTLSGHAPQAPEYRTETFQEGGELAEYEMIDGQRGRELSRGPKWNPKGGGQTINAQNFSGIKLEKGEELFQSIDENGNTSYRIQVVPGSKLAGEIPEREKKADAQKRLTDSLGELRNLYSDLDAAGGIVSTDSSVADNIFASIASSGAGQAVGTLAGNENQSRRNKIKALQPIILNAVRQATGMGAKAMDSDAELKFYMRSVTDPKVDVQTAGFAIKMLKANYGVDLSGLQISDKSTRPDPLGIR
jgi:hypothetical protein